MSDKQVISIVFGSAAGTGSTSDMASTTKIHRIGFFFSFADAQVNDTNDLDIASGRLGFSITDWSTTSSPFRNRGVSTGCALIGTGTMANNTRVVSTDDKDYLPCASGPYIRIFMTTAYATPDDIRIWLRLKTFGDVYKWYSLAFSYAGQSRNSVTYKIFNSDNTSIVYRGIYRLIELTGPPSGSPLSQTTLQSWGELQTYLGQADSTITDIAAQTLSISATLSSFILDKFYNSTTGVLASLKVYGNNAYTNPTTVITSINVGKNIPAWTPSSTIGTIDMNSAYVPCFEIGTVNGTPALSSSQPYYAQLGYQSVASAGTEHAYLSRVLMDYGSGVSKCVNKLVIFSPTPGYNIEWSKFEIVASTNGIDFIRLPTKWYTPGASETKFETTFSLYWKRARPGNGGNTAYSIVPALSGARAQDVVANNTPFSATSNFPWRSENSGNAIAGVPLFMWNIDIDNASAYRYYGFGNVGSDIYFSDNTFSGTPVTTYTRSPCGYSGFSAVGPIYNWARYGTDATTGWSTNSTPTLNTTGLTNISNVDKIRIFLPQISSDTPAAAPTYYKYWRIRPTTSFLTTIGTGFNLYLWKLGLYRTVDEANADTYGFSSNNYLQQYGNTMYINDMEQSPTNATAMFVHTGVWDARIAVIDTTGYNTLKLPVSNPSSNIYFKLDVYGEINAIRFPNYMKFDANVRGGTFILERGTALSITDLRSGGTTTATATTNRAHSYRTGDYVSIAGATQAGYNLSVVITVPFGSDNTFTYNVVSGLQSPATTTTTITSILWEPMVVTKNQVSGNTLARNGIISESKTGSAGEELLSSTLYTIQTVADAGLSSYVAPTQSDNLSTGGSLAYNQLKEGITIRLTNGTNISYNTKEDFSIHFSNSSTPLDLSSGLIKFNCTVTDYASPIITFSTTPDFTGDGYFHIFIRSGKRTGITSSTASIVTTSVNVPPYAYILDDRVITTSTGSWTGMGSTARHLAWPITVNNSTNLSYYTEYKPDILGEYALDPSSLQQVLSITNLSSGGTTTATATTATAHSYKVGDYVNISGASLSGYNLSVVINTVPTIKTFTYTVASGLGTPTGTITCILLQQVLSITNLSSGGTTTATATTATAHSYNIGNYVNIRGASLSGYNLSVVINTVPTSTSFTYTVVSGLGIPTGTITCNLWQPISNKMFRSIGTTAFNGTITANVTGVKYLMIIENESCLFNTAAISNSVKWTVTSTSPSLSGKILKVDSTNIKGTFSTSISDTTTGKYRTNFNFTSGTSSSTASDWFSNVYVNGCPIIADNSTLTSIGPLTAAKGLRFTTTTPAGSVDAALGGLCATDYVMHIEFKHPVIIRIDGFNSYTNDSGTYLGRGTSGIHTFANYPRFGAFNAYAHGFDTVGSGLAKDTITDIDSFITATASICTGLGIPMVETSTALRPILSKAYGMPIDVSSSFDYYGPMNSADGTLITFSPTYPSVFLKPTARPRTYNNTSLVPIDLYSSKWPWSGYTSTPLPSGYFVDPDSGLCAISNDSNNLPIAIIKVSPTSKKYIYINSSSNPWIIGGIKGSSNPVTPFGASPAFRGTIIPTSSITINTLSSGGTTTATATTASAHSYRTGDYVSITGATQAGYNLIAIITVPFGSANTFTYTVVSGLTSPATTATTINSISWKPLMTSSIQSINYTAISWVGCAFHNQKCLSPVTGAKQSFVWSGFYLGSGTPQLSPVLMDGNNINTSKAIVWDIGFANGDSLPTAYSSTAYITNNSGPNNILSWTALPGTDPNDRNTLHVFTMLINNNVTIASNIDNWVQLYQNGIKLSRETTTTATALTSDASSGKFMYNTLFTKITSTNLATVFNGASTAGGVPAANAYAVASSGTQWSFAENNVQTRTSSPYDSSDVYSIMSDLSTKWGIVPPIYDNSGGVKNLVVIDNSDTSLSWVGLFNISRIGFFSNLENAVDGSNSLDLTRNITSHQNMLGFDSSVSWGEIKSSSPLDISGRGTYWATTNSTFNITNNWGHVTTTGIPCGSFIRLSMQFTTSSSALMAANVSKVRIRLILCHNGVDSLYGLGFSYNNTSLNTADNAFLSDNGTTTATILAHRSVFRLVKSKHSTWTAHDAASAGNKWEWSNPYTIEMDSLRLSTYTTFAQAKNFAVNANSLSITNFTPTFKSQYLPLSGTCNMRRFYYASVGVNIPSWNGMWMAETTDTRALPSATASETNYTNIYSAIDGVSGFTTDTKNSPLGNDVGTNVSDSLVRYMWYFSTATKVDKLMFYSGTPGWQSEWIKFEIVASNDGINFVRLPTEWYVSSDTVEETFHIKYNRKSKGNFNTFVFADTLTPANSTSDTNITAGKFLLTTANTRPIVWYVSFINDTKYKYYGFGNVGTDTPYYDLVNYSSNVTTRTYSRRPFSSSIAGTAHQTKSLSSNASTMVGYAVTTNANLMANTNNLPWLVPSSGSSQGYGTAIIPIVSTGGTNYGGSFSRYKYWRLRATSGFLGATGTAKAYFWKLGLYKNSADAAADTTGLSSNNYFQQFANIVSINGTVVTASTNQHKAICVNLGTWNQKYTNDASDNIGGISGTNALGAYANLASFGSDSYYFLITLDVAPDITTISTLESNGTIGAGQVPVIRFPSFMRFDSSMGGI